jgi:hypothetical protein
MKTISKQRKAPLPITYLQKRILLKAGFSIVICDTRYKSVTIVTPNDTVTLPQETKENTRQRAMVYTSPNMVVFLDGVMSSLSMDQLNRSGIVAREHPERSRMMGRSTYIIEQQITRSF